MVRGTIDHMIALLLTLIIASFSLSYYSTIISAAITYQSNSRVAAKNADLIESILQSPGYPQDWGRLNSAPQAFGLQDPTARGISVSPFAPQKLLPPEKTFFYEGSWYNNVSLTKGAYLNLPLTEHLNISAVANLLGISESYGFRLDIEPTLTVSVTEISYSPFKFRVEVNGLGGPLSQASLKGTLFYTKWDPPTPSIDNRTSSAKTNSTGLAIIEFPFSVSSLRSYYVVVIAHLNGLVGIGTCSNSNIIMSLGKDFLIPLISDYTDEDYNGTAKIALVHRRDITGEESSGAIFYNLTMFFVMSQDYGFSRLEIENSTGKVTNGYPAYLHIRTSDPGFLLIGYRTEGQNYGILIVPWGICSIGISVAIGGDSSGSQWVASNLRQAVIGQVSYRVKLQLWSLQP